VKAPTVKALVAEFRDLDEKGARQIRKLAREAGSNPDAALREMDKILDMHGVEALGPRHYDYFKPSPYEYLNAGDTYATTLIYDRAKDTLSIGCYGDVVEAHPEWDERE
jgi:hypothetical protein